MRIHSSELSITSLPRMAFVGAQVEDEIAIARWENEGGAIPGD